MEPSQDDGFKWFGEGFDGFPRRLPDDTVEYCIFLIDDQLDSISALRARLSEVLKAANQRIDGVLKDYIWQRDGFSLKIRDPQKHTVPARDEERLRTDKPHGRDGGEEAALPSHLYGRTNFGDSIADEWLVVYLLRELSRQCAEAWIRVSDTDGEFLLIEAAHALPKWLEPDTAANRVWLHNGHLQLIPLEEGGAKDEARRDGGGGLSLRTALDVIRTRKETLVVSPFVEEAAFARLAEYPGAIEGSLHHAAATVPRRLAHVLRRRAASVAPAIEAFYLRDAVAMRPLATKDTSTLRLPPEDFVTVSVRFTKVGYAQLRSQVFEAPPAWTGFVPRLGEERARVGMKLTCGVEMMLADPANMDKRVVREVGLLLEDVESGEESLPSDEEIAAWSMRHDDEKWLDIDFKDFEAELSGKGGDDTGKKGDVAPGSAQENLRKMVSRFQDFIEKDSGGIRGVDDEDNDGADLDADEEDEEDEEDESGSQASSSGEDKEGSFDEAEFEKAMREMMGMSGQEIEESGLLEEARRLAVEDGDAEEGGEDDEEETKKTMEMMERELNGHGALGSKARRSKRNDETRTSAAKVAKATDGKSVTFGPVLPPGFRRQGGVAREEEESADEDVGPGDGELSSDDEEFNDVDVDLARNLLESFKGQAGMSGPAGNLMKALGVNMPRDED